MKMEKVKEHKDMKRMARQQASFHFSREARVLEIHSIKRFLKLKSVQKMVEV